MRAKFNRHITVGPERRPIRATKISGELYLSAVDISTVLGNTHRLISRHTVLKPDEFVRVVPLSAFIEELPRMYTVSDEIIERRHRRRHCRPDTRVGKFMGHFDLDISEQRIKWLNRRLANRKPHARRNKKALVTQWAEWLTNLEPLDYNETMKMYDDVMAEAGAAKQ